MAESYILAYSAELLECTCSAIFPEKSSKLNDIFELRYEQSGDQAVKNFGILVVLVMSKVEHIIDLVKASVCGSMSQILIKHEQLLSKYQNLSIQNSILKNTYNQNFYEIINQEHSISNIHHSRLQKPTQI